MTNKTYFHELWEPKYDIKLKIGQRLLYSFFRFLIQFLKVLIEIKDGQPNLYLIRFNLDFHMIVPRHLICIKHPIGWSKDLFFQFQNSFLKIWPPYRS